MATVKFYLTRPKTKGVLKTTPVAITLRFTLDRKNRFDIGSGEVIVPKGWDFLKQEAKSSFRGHTELNQVLSTLRRDVIQTWRDNKQMPLKDLQVLCGSLVKHGTVTSPVEKKKCPHCLESIHCTVSEGQRREDSVQV